ncbi:MAG: hypothetical protein RLZZ299_1929 [Pseudomonadota bacterium]|jgi:aminopeptidase N
MTPRAWLVAAGFLVACDSPDDKAPTPSDTGVSSGGRQDILTTDLSLHLRARSGFATISVVPAAGADEVVLEVDGLEVVDVFVEDSAVDARVVDGLLRVPVDAARPGPVTVGVDYVFPARTLGTFDGWMPAQGVTFLWPYFCSHLFPCTSSMEDGVTFTMTVTGTDPALTAVYPRTTTTDAPAYMPAVAVGPYARVDLGTTTAGTAVKAWYFDVPGAMPYVQAGTAHLADVVDFFERTYGPYAFGPEIGSVEVDWGADSYGGMEHHPYSHIATFDYADEEVHAHEAAHGWFGDAVRVGCWEDFVLSEGTVTYMAGRGLEQVGGPDVWPMYVDYLDAICAGEDVNAVALPDTCGEIDLLEEDLWSMVPYMKGACFYEDVGERIGFEAVDAAIAEFYRAHVNRTGHMRDMIDTLAAHAPEHERAAIDALAVEWLETYACPADYAARCGSHQRP